MKERKGGMKMKRFMNFLKETDGATAVEYGIMVAAIAAVIITIVISLGERTNAAFTATDSAMATIPGTPTPPAPAP